jgi:hypothetical protein
MQAKLPKSWRCLSLLAFLNPAPAGSESNPLRNHTLRRETPHEQQIDRQAAQTQAAAIPNFALNTGNYQ